MKIKLWRDADGLAQTNVPHKVIRHSPSGLFDFGFAGLGPADLALNILLMFIPKSTAELLYQDFKKEIIANIPFEGITLEESAIRSWVNQKMSNSNAQED